MPRRRRNGQTANRHDGGGGPAVRSQPPQGAGRLGGMHSLPSMLSIAVELLAAAVAPARCAACDAPVARLVVLCDACASTAEWTHENDSFWDSAPCAAPRVAAFAYGGAIARAIGRLKYERRADLARPLGDLLWRALQPHAVALRNNVVVPVPLHPSRLVERGFNQSALIARPVARRLAAPLRPLALARIRDTPQQAALDRQARIANVVDAFRVRQPQQIDRRAVLLIDDVCTTGATLDACTKALMAAGAASVAHAVVARVRPDDT
jgi:ComF family protein